MGTVSYQNKLVIVMSALHRTGFDFVGELVDEDDTTVVLRNPLVLYYEEDRTVSRVAYLHLPLGITNPLKPANMHYPKDAMAYFVVVDEKDHPIGKMYRDFFIQESQQLPMAPRALAEADRGSAAPAPAPQQ